MIKINLLEELSQLVSWHRIRRSVLGCASHDISEEGGVDFDTGTKARLGLSRGWTLAQHCRSFLPLMSVHKQLPPPCAITHRTMWLLFHCSLESIESQLCFNKASTLSQTFLNSKELYCQHIHIRTITHKNELTLPWDTWCYNECKFKYYSARLQ